MHPDRKDPIYCVLRSPSERALTYIFRAVKILYILGSHKQIGYSVLLSRWKLPRLKYLHIATSCENKYYSHYMQSAVEYTDIGLFIVFSNDPLQISHWTSSSVAPNDISTEFWS